MRAWRDHRTDLVKVRRHRLGIAMRHDEACRLAFGRTDRAEDIGRLCALIVRCGWPCSAPGPAAGDLVLLADARFILKPQLYFGAGRERLADFRHTGREVFLKASIASRSCA